MRELITEGLRVQRDGELIEYINVGHALEDACARANHTIFRRGCGKTLLLHNSRSKLKADLRSIYLNCEDFKQHTFPNVLIEILKALFREIDQNLSGWFGKKARTKAIVKQILARLDKMHQAPDAHTEQVKETSGRETGKNMFGELSGEHSNFKAKFGAGELRGPIQTLNGHLSDTRRSCKNSTASRTQNEPERVLRHFDKCARHIPSNR